MMHSSSRIVVVGIFVTAFVAVALQVIALPTALRGLLQDAASDDRQLGLPSNVTIRRIYVGRMSDRNMPSYETSNSPAGLKNLYDGDRVMQISRLHKAMFVHIPKVGSEYLHSKWNKLT